MNTTQGIRADAMQFGKLYWYKHLGGVTEFSGIARKTSKGVAVLWLYDGVKPMWGFDELPGLLYGPIEVPEPPKQETSCLHPDLVCDQQAPSPTFNCADCKEHVSWQTVYRRLHVKIANLEKSVQRLGRNEELYGTTKP